MIDSLILSLTMLCMVGCSTPPVRLDNSMQANLAGDTTGIVFGCGNQPVSGYTYCRKTEGPIGNDALYFLAPIVKCKNEPCRTLKIFSPDSSTAYGIAFKEGSDEVLVKWTDIVKRQHFDVQDRGFWPFIIEVRFLAEDGFEHKTILEGEIRLRILRKEYVSLHSVKDDTAFFWIWESHGHLLKVSASGRTTVLKPDSK
jgi:hypothetical protein